jgi:Glycosyl hydrolase family 12
VRQIIARHDADADTSPEAGPPGKRVIPLSRAGIIGVAAACAVLAAGGLAAASLTGGGAGSGARQADVKNVAVGGSGAGTGAGNAASAMPQLAAGPRMAVMPKATTSSPAAARSGSPAAGPSAPAGGGSATCAHPSFVTSDQYGMWNQAPYFVYNDMWGISGYSVSQTLSACSYGNWYVTATMNNDNGDGHVKTYPNSHRDWDSEPAISSLQSVTSTFAETSPGTGIYEDAYDIWLNGIADSGSTEVMIWTENHGQVPAGNQVATVTLDGRSWAVWKAGSYIAFVAGSNFTSGTMNLLMFFQWITGQGWIPGNSTLGQVDYGVELVSTNGVPATFSFSDFSVSAS